MRSAHMNQDQLHAMAGIRLMPAQVAVMTIFYKSVKSKDYFGNDIGVVARGVSRARNGTLHSRMARVRDATNRALVCRLN